MRVRVRVWEGSNRQMYIYISEIRWICTTKAATATTEWKHRTNVGESLKQITQIVVVVVVVARSNK